MPISGKYIGYKEILRSVYRDFEFNYELQHVDALEWIGALMRLLNVHNSLKDKVTDNNLDLDHPDFIKIEDFRGKLPCDMHSITQTAAFLGNALDFACKGSLIPMNYSTDTMYKYTNDVCCRVSGEDCAACEEDEEDSFNIPSANDPTDPSTLITYYSPSDIYSPGALTYKVNDNHIFTNFQCGYVVMAYKAVPLDEEGFPLVPAEQQFIEAAKREVAYKIATKLWLRGDMTADKFQWFERERNWYIASASNNANMMSLDELQSFTNDRLRLIPKTNQHRGFFAGLQIPEAVYSHPYQYNRRAY